MYFELDWRATGKGRYCLQKMLKDISYKVEGNRRILNTLQPDLLCTAYVGPAWQIHTRTWNLFLQIRRTYFIFKVNEMLYKLVSGLRVVLETMNKSKSFQKWEFYSWRRQIHLLVFKCLLLLLKSFEYSPIIMMDIQIQILYRYSIIYIFSLLVVLLIFLIVANWSLQYVCTAPSPALTKLPTCVLLLALSKSASSTIYCAHIFVIWTVSVCSKSAPSTIYCAHIFVNSILCSYERFLCPLKVRRQQYTHVSNFFWVVFPHLEVIAFASLRKIYQH